MPSAGEALSTIQECIDLAADVPEVYSVQSRVLKHAGDPEGAAAAACKAESLDLADRQVPHHAMHLHDCGLHFTVHTNHLVSQPLFIGVGKA